MKSYVYIYFDPRVKSSITILGTQYFSEPFYIGKGTGKRLYDHLTESSKINRIKHGKIQHLLEEGNLPIILKVKENLSNIEASDLEKQLIAEIGTIANIDGIKRGPLSNLTIGGDGGRQSLETRIKMSLNRKGKSSGPRSEKTKEKISLSKRGITTISAEGRTKLSEFRKTFKTSEQTKQKLAVASKGRIHTDETIQKISLSQKGIPREYAKGNQNSKGLITINNGIRGKQIKPEELDSFLSLGWSKGIFRRKLNEIPKICL